MSAGRVRAIATTGSERNPALPDLPTVADTLPGYEITQSWGIVVPAGTPAEVVKRLGDEFAKALANPEVRDKILKTGAVPASNDSPAVFTDGPFGETKEVIGGYWFILAGSLEEAARIAQGNPCLRCGLFYEIRPIELQRAVATALTNETPIREESV